MSGWTGGTCERDVNECDAQEKQAECDAKSAVCVNFQGGYSCQCETGYAPDSQGICQGQYIYNYIFNQGICKVSIVVAFSSLRPFIPRLRFF